MKRLSLFIAFAAAFFILVAPIGVIYADSQSDLAAACATAEANGSKKPAYCSATAKDNPIAGDKGIINKVADVIAYIAGAVAVIMVVYGGFKYIVSNGDPQKITSARQIITYALIGLVVVLLAKLILSFVINRLA
jgi:hypothetical protein